MEEMPTTLPPPEEAPEEALMIECENCGRDIDEADTHVLEGHSLCGDCYEGEARSCVHCGIDAHRDNTRHVHRNGDVCERCFRNLPNIFFQCEDCEICFSRQQELNIPSHRNTCNPCEAQRLLEDNEDWEEDETNSSRSLQSKKLGNIIKSTRRIGIELETNYIHPNSEELLSEYISDEWNFHGDGSLRISKNACGTVEIVSPVMAGVKAENEILLLSKKAQEAGFFVNTSCGFHLHLEAKEFRRQKKEDKLEHIEGLPAHYVIYHCVGGIYDGHRSRTIEELPKKENGEPWKYKIITLEQPNSFIVNRGKSFYALRDLWFVYLAFDDVFRGMQPMSRRNNRFCIATSTIYSIEQIRELEDFSQLERLWYKIDKRKKLDSQFRDAEDRKSCNKDGTRYSGFNLEPLLSRRGTGTVEIRYHSPTLNSEKILRWINIHQTIMDKVATGEWDENLVNAILASETHLLRKARLMCSAFGISNETKNYIIERLHKFNKFEATEKDMQDEEVDESPIGSPQHRPPTVLRLTRPQIIEEENTSARVVRTISRDGIGGIRPEIVQQRINQIVEATGGGGLNSFS